MELRQNKVNGKSDQQYAPCDGLSFRMFSTLSLMFKAWFPLTTIAPVRVQHFCRLDPIGSTQVTQKTSNMKLVIICEKSRLSHLPKITQKLFLKSLLHTTYHILPVPSSFRALAKN